MGSDETEVREELALLQRDFADIWARYAAARERVARLVERGGHSVLGYSRPETLLVDALLIPVGEAKQLVAHASATTPTVTLTGYQRPPELPATADAARDGAISAAHVQVIATTMDAIPDTVPDDEKVAAEAALAGYATTMPPQALSKAAKHLLDVLDPDGAMPSEAELAQPDNVFWSQRTRTGRMKFKGEIDTEAAEELEALLTSMAMPTGPTELRGHSARMGDAFTELVHLAATTPDLPGKTSTVPTVIVTMDHDALTKQTGAALLDGGHQLPATAARRIACDANVIPTVLGTKSVILDQGRKYRAVTREQRIALITRDKGCAFPHCDRPPRFCDAHHVKHWADGGPTDLNNLVLLCRRHHRIIHHSAWTLRMVDGLPEFTPPDWINNRVCRTPHGFRSRTAGSPMGATGGGVCHSIRMEPRGTRLPLSSYTATT